MEQEAAREPRSRHSFQSVFVRFKNLTNRTVKVVWVNYTGQYIKYREIPPKQYMDVNTFKTHPWMAFDSNTADQMHIDKAFIYMPKTWQEYFAHRYLPHQIIRDGFMPRILVRITLPLYSLRHLALMTIRDNLLNPEDADGLELPQTLIEDIKKAVRHRNNQNSIPMIMQ